MSELNKRAQEIFEQSLDHSTHDRNGYIANACGNDADLLAQVMTLLKYHGDTEHEDELSDDGMHHPKDLIGTTIGRYVIRDVIGEGGFGVVYLAEQQDPIKRMVAMKIIRTGMDTKSVIARFHAERQALAMMDHPGIASIIDGGTTRSPLDWMELDQDGDGIITKEEWLAAHRKIDANNDGEITIDEWRAATDLGRPYFVMEYVDGLPLNEFCNKHCLPINDRIRLFQKVCSAIQHAHSKGIIHRDLKPSNVLASMDEDGPRATVIDFGIAKAIDARVGNETFMTAHGHFIGTPEYMSPEQFNSGAADVDTRSDIYALGVLLYELLAGRLPFDREEIRKANLIEVQRIIQEEEPPKPSTGYDRLRTTQIEVMEGIAKDRQSMPARLQKRLRGDLDWIVMRCLEKDRDRRYETASELQSDLNRYLNHQPTNAGPPSARYRFAKYARRKAGLLTALVAVFTVLITGLLIASWFAFDANRQRASLAIQSKLAETAKINAESESQRAQAVTKFIQDMLASANPSNSSSKGNASLVTLLDNASTRISNEFKNSPTTQADLHSTMGNTYISLGMLDKSYPHLKAAHELRLRVLGEFDTATLEATQSLGNLLRKQGKFDDAMPLYKEVLEHRITTLGEKHPDTLISLGNMGVLLMNMGDLEGAEKYLKQDVESCTNIFGQRDHRTLNSTNNYGMLLYQMGRYNESESYLKSTLSGRMETFGEDHPRTIESKSNLGQLIQAQAENPGQDEHVQLAKFNEAERLFKQSLESRTNVLGENHPDTLFSLSALGALYMQWHENRPSETKNLLGEAERYVQEALQKRRVILGDSHPSTVVSVVAAGDIAWFNGDIETADSLFKEALSSQVQTLGEEHPSTCYTMQCVGLTTEVLLGPDEASEYFERAYQGRLKTLGANHPETAHSLDLLSLSRVETGEIEKATSLFKLRLDNNLEKYGPMHPTTLASMDGLAFCLFESGNQAEAIELIERCVGIRQDVFGESHLLTIESTVALCTYLCESQRHKEAIPLLRECLAQLNEISELNSSVALRAIDWLAAALYSTDQIGEAIEFAEQSLELHLSMLGKNHPSTLSSMHDLSGYYLDNDMVNESLAMANDCLRGRATVLGETHRETLQTMQRVALPLLIQGESETALSLFDSCLNICRNVFGNNDPLTLSAMHQYAYALSEVGQISLSIPLYKECLQIRRQTMGSNHIAIIPTIQNLAIDLHQNDQQDCISLQIESVQLHANHYGQDHPDSVEALTLLAEFYTSFDRHSEAADAYEACLRVRRNSLGHSHPLTLESLHALAESYSSCNKHFSANRLFSECLTARKAVLGELHPDTLFTMFCYADNLSVAGPADLALKMYEDCLEGERKIYGPTANETLLTLNNFGYFLDTLGEHDRALDLLSECLDIEIQNLGPSHYSTLATMTNKARCLANLDRHTEALSLYQDAAERWIENFGLGHPDTDKFMSPFISYLDSHASSEEAQKYRDLLTPQTQLQSPGTPKTAPEPAGSGAP